MSLSAEQVTGLLVDGLSAGVAQNWPRAFTCLSEAMGDDPTTGYGLACAMATIVVADGLIATEVVDLDPTAAPSPRAEVVEIVAAYIAAHANDDTAGTLELYRQMLAAEDEWLVGMFFRTLFEITVAVVVPRSDS